MNLFQIYIAKGLFMKQNKLPEYRCESFLRVKGIDPDENRGIFQLYYLGYLI